MAKKKPPKTQLKLFTPEVMVPFTELDAARETALKCTKCPLHETRTKVVFGHGNHDSPDLMFIGEAPGANEDLQGLPFIGRSGELFDKMLEAIRYKREDVYVANIVCCRPPMNRPPAPREIAQCMDYLIRQIAVVRPKLLVLLGQSAAEAVTGKTFKSMEGARQNWYEYDDIPMRATYHPAYLLRTPAKKPEALEDLKAIRARVMQITENFRG